MRRTTVVARVEATAIRYAEIRVPRRHLDRGCLLEKEFSSEPETDDFEDRRRRVRLGLERARLKARILEIVREETARSLGIELPDSEFSEAIRHRLNRLLSEATMQDIRTAVGRELARNYRVRAAQRAVRAGIASEEAYHRYELSDSQPQWVFRVGAADSFTEPDPAQPAKLPAAVPIRSRLLEERLNERIDAELAVCDDEYRSYLDAQQCHDETTLRRFFRANPLFQQVKRAEWWARRLQQMRIRIDVDSFLPVMTELACSDAETVSGSPAV